jgi:hypothetical protein
MWRLVVALAVVRAATIQTDEGFRGRTRPFRDGRVRK